MKYIIKITLVLNLLVILPVLIQSQEIKKENLGENINSKYVDMYPVISPDGETLYFYRSFHPDNYGKEKKGDIWFSKKQPDGTWSKAENIGPPLNNAYNNFVCSVTPDGNTLLIGNVYLKNGGSRRGVSITHKTENGWQFPEEVKIDNFYNLDRFFGEFYLSNDGKTMLMAITRHDTKGMLDLYVSFIKDDKTWTEPKNLGPVINTPANDFSPFLASDGRTLYFSSYGHGGYGKSDLFFSRRLDNTWTNWSEPVNLGPTINTPDDDTKFFLPASGDYAYFSSKYNSYGMDDIFRIKLTDSLKPHPVVLLYGKVRDSKNNHPVEATVYYEKLPEGKELGVARSSPITGLYKIVLPPGMRYGIRAEAPGYISINDNFDATALQEYKSVEMDLDLVPAIEGETIRLNNIFFDFDKYNLRPDSYPELKRVVKFLKDNPKIKIKIDGHTDERGTVKYNLNLSDNRARSVYEYLVQNGIARKRLGYQGFGKSRPITRKKTEAAHQLNRRVEFTIMKN